MGIALENTGSGGSREESSSLFGELFNTRLYKPTQGRITRQATGGAVWLAAAIASWRWFQSQFGYEWLGKYMTESAFEAVHYALPALLLVAGLWFGYRLVNYPKFADFLIAVEAEMNKVMWPSQAELIRSSVVVILLLASLTLVLFLYDVIWYYLFILIGVR